jgi:hypothetical protein
VIPESLRSAVAALDAQINDAGVEPAQENGPKSRKKG